MTKKANSVQVTKTYDQPLSMGTVSKICHTSKKTTLNWVYQKKLKVFTTVGGHYRIWPGDLAIFLHKYGVDVPFKYTERRYKTILLIGYGHDSGELLTRAIHANTERSQILSSDNFAESLLTIGDKKPALVVLNWDMMPSLSAALVTGLLAWWKTHPFKLAVTSADGNHISIIRNILPEAEDGHLASGYIANIIQLMPNLLA